MKCPSGPSVPDGNRQQLRCRPPTNEFRPGRRPRSTQWTWRHHRRICNSNWPSISDMCQVADLIGRRPSLKSSHRTRGMCYEKDIFSALVVNESTTPCTTSCRYDENLRLKLCCGNFFSHQVIGQDSRLEIPFFDRSVP